MDEQNFSNGNNGDVQGQGNQPQSPPRTSKSGVSAKGAVKSTSTTMKTRPIRLGDEPQKKDDDNRSFFDRIYDEIENVIGGDNPNQFLCLTIPGQALTAEDFAYDYKQNAEKGPTVEANESRLANKLFDPCHVTGADNGMTLPYQYRSALDTLTPKLNSKIAAAKNQLRELLLTPYPYEFGDGDTKTYTLQQVFYRLYDEYVAAEQAWAEKQNKKKEELRKMYPGSTAEENKLYNNAYLQWYETVAKSEVTFLNEKRAKVLSVFAPNDMDILDGVLDSGSGAELEQAREILENIQKETPDGGVIYPVKFNPTNWFELLDTSFIPTDLLESPAALAMQMSNLSARRISLSARIEDIASLIPEGSKIDELKKRVADKKTALDEAQRNLIADYGEGFKTVITTAFDIASLFEGGGSGEGEKQGKVPEGVIAKIAGGMTFPDGKTLGGLIDSLSTINEANITAQTDYINASQNLSDELADLINAENMESLKGLMSPLKEQLEKVNAQIADLENRIRISEAIKTSKNAGTGDGKGSLQDVTPPEVPTGYTQILIEADASSMDKQTSKTASATNSTSGVSFWFAGYSSKHESSSSSFSEMQDGKNSTIRIGMNIAKVGIEREWFNPGLFVLTKDMFNVSTSRISPQKSYDAITDERLHEMAKGYIFPCYPVAMLIARDISIQVSSESDSFSSFANTTEEHASRGGGFLLFSGSKSSSSSSSSSGVHTESKSKSVTIKFSTPQIIGYYLQATPADNSVIIDDISAEETAAGYVTIAKFVEDYKKMLDKMNKKENE